MQRSRRSGSSWIGWLIFVFLVFGVRFLPPVAAWLSQVTGLTITVPMLIIAVVVLSVVVSIVSALAGSMNQSGSDEPGMPSSPPQAPSSPRSRSLPKAPTPPTASAPPRASSPWPTTTPGSGLPRARLPSGQQQLPGPPRFEPIIDPRILGIGIVGLVLLGGLALLLFFMSGALP